MLQTGTHQFISIDQVLSSAKADLGIMDNNSYDVNFFKWANDAILRIGGKNLFLKLPANLTITNNRAELPKGFRQYLGLRFFETVEVVNADGSTTERKVCSPLLYVDQDFYNNCNCGPYWDNTLYQNYIAVFQIVGNELIFQDLPDGTQVQLSYIGVQVDDNCDLLSVPVTYELAVVAYVRYKFLQAFHEVKGNFTPMLMREAKSEWIGQRSKARALATLEEFNNSRYQCLNLARAWFYEQTVR